MVDVELTWNLSSTPSSDVNGQYVYRSDVSNPSFPSDFIRITDLGDSVTSYTDTGRATGQSLTYAVTAYNQYGESSPTTDTVQTLAVPTNLTITDSSIEDQLSLSWDQANGANGYYVYRAESSGSTTPDYTQVADVTSASYTDTVLEDGEQYFYRVSSHD